MMLVPLSWLREYVDLTLSPEELARRLTLAGISVAAIHRRGDQWEQIFVGEVESIHPHPSASDILIAEVRSGIRRLKVITGAPNVHEGAKVALALPGARLFDGHSAEPREFTVEPREIRGVLSEAVLCSEKELGLSDDHSGLLLLPLDVPVGAELRTLIGDTVLDLEVTPNRADCLSLIGVAREVAALTSQRLRPPEVDLPLGSFDPNDFAQIIIDDPDLCARYTGIVIRGVRIGPSPAWIQERLLAAGMRPINNVVDVTNYVMLELGQPLHAFDLDKLGDRRIIVRRARLGERITTLDGEDRELTGDVLVIADAKKPVAIAGVMGGMATEVTDATENLLLESANFNPISIRLTARALHLTTEASRRFERGQPPENTPSIRRAAQLISQLAGGSIGRTEIDAYPRPREARHIVLTTHDVRRLLGVDLSPHEIANRLARLEFECQPTPNSVRVTVPPHRLDVTAPADLVEEVARIGGYGSLPTSLPKGSLPPQLRNDALFWEEAAREVMVGCGFSEVITYSLTSRQRVARLLPPDAWLQTLTAQISDRGGPAIETIPDLPPLLDYRLWKNGGQPVMVVNPLSANAECLRLTTLSNLLETLRENLRWRSQDIRLFEIGRIYLPREEGLPDERRSLTLAIGGYLSGRELGSRVEADLLDIKGAIEELLERMGILTYTFSPVCHPTFVPGRTALIRIGSGEAARSVGILGEVDEHVRDQFDLSQTALLAALDMEPLIQSANDIGAYQPLPQFPAVRQDLAIVVDEATPAATVQEIIIRAGRPLAKEATLFDIYRGEQVPVGKKGLAYTITYLAEDHTLSDDEVRSVHHRIGQTLHQELGAQLRA